MSLYKLVSDVFGTPVCPALVVPGVDDVLFGALPMEGLDLIVHPREEKIVGAHGDTTLRLLK